MLVRRTFYNAFAALAALAFGAASLTWWFSGASSDKRTASSQSAPAQLSSEIAIERPQAISADVRATPGDWTWGIERGRSTARFAGDLFVVVCDRTDGNVTLFRRGNVSGPVRVNVMTTDETRPTFGQPNGNYVAVSLPVHDRLLDAIAFSKGRFGIDVPGLETLYVPSWAEVSRVIEDCR